MEENVWKATALSYLEENKELIKENRQLRHDLDRRQSFFDRIEETLNSYLERMSDPK